MSAECASVWPGSVRSSVMFERLLSVLRPTHLAGPLDSGTPPAGIREALGSLAGSTLEFGLYRFHTRSSAAAADRLVADAYPDFAGRIACFGMDWLGRQFSLDPSRGAASDPPILLFDIGAGQALEIPTAFSAFHDEELIDYTDAALACAFFQEWLRIHPGPSGSSSASATRCRCSWAALTSSTTSTSLTSTCTGPSPGSCGRPSSTDTRSDRCPDAHVVSPTHSRSVGMEGRRRPRPVVQADLSAI